MINETTVAIVYFAIVISLLVCYAIGHCKAVDDAYERLNCEAGKTQWRIYCHPLDAPAPTAERRMIMGLDITFKQRTKNVCPHCGKEIAQTYDVDAADSGGRCWYPFLESIGYYVPYDKRTEENNWYGKDMVLTKEQAEYAYRFAKEEEVYNCHEVVSLIAVALAEKCDIVVNADW